jgi:hypothetical protein
MVPLQHIEYGIQESKHVHYRLPSSRKPAAVRKSFSNRPGFEDTRERGRVDLSSSSPSRWKATWRHGGRGEPGPGWWCMGAPSTGGSWAATHLDDPRLAVPWKSCDLNVCRYIMQTRCGQAVASPTLARTCMDLCPVHATRALMVRASLQDRAISLSALRPRAAGTAAHLMCPSSATFT